MSQLTTYFDQNSTEFPFRVNLSIAREQLIQDEEFLVLRINGLKFAIFDKPITSSEALTIDLQNYNVIFLSSVEAKKDITIQAITIICFNSLYTSQGKTSLYASDKLLIFIKDNQSRNFLKGGCLIAKEGVFGRSLDGDVLQGLIEKFENGVDGDDARLLSKTLFTAVRFAMRREEENFFDEMRFLGVPIIERHKPDVKEYAR